MPLAAPPRARRRRLREQEALAAAERFATLKGERDQLTVSMRSIAGEVLSGTTDQLIKLAAAQRTARQNRTIVQRNAQAES